MSSSNNNTVRILAVDDLPPVLNLYKKAITGQRRSGEEEFSLTVARQGLEAVDRVREAFEEGSPYSVAFIDIHMPPGIDGVETARLIREIDERIYVVFVTGEQIKDIDRVNELLDHNVLYIQKPFHMYEVLQLARTLSLSWLNSRQLERSVDRAELESAEQLVEAKSNFLATMSHELRTPLSAIIGNCEYLSGQLGNTEHLQVMDSIHSAGKHQLALVNDILDLSKIESGKFSVDEAPYDLKRLLNNLRQMLSVKAQDAGVEFSITQKNEETHELLGDDQRIGQVLINLLSNAFKFAPRGTVSLTVWQDEQGLHFEVKDDGIGMSEETVDKLFGCFEQADGSISRKFGGTGLGLYISLNLAQLMEGTIEVTSTLGEGSIFRLMLPYRPSEIEVMQSEPQQERAAAVVKELLTGEVLIVEDTPAMMALARRSVAQFGATVTEAVNGKEAVELATATRFDLILMDMQMPVMDGIEATRTLREQGNDTPVIVVSANVMQEHREAFDEVGSNGFLAKPFYSEELRKIMKPYLTVVEVEEEVEAAEVQVEQAEAVAEVPVEVISAGGRRVPPGELDDMINDEILGQFYENLVGTRDSLEQAWQEGDWQQVREVSHVIKGYGIPFGYPVVSSIGMALNESAKKGEQNPDLVQALLHYLDDVIEYG